MRQPGFPTSLRTLLSAALLLIAWPSPGTRAVEVDGCTFGIENLANLRIEVTDQGNDQWTGSCEASTEATCDFQLADTISATGAMGGSYSAAVVPNLASSPGGVLTVSAAVENPDLLGVPGGATNVHIGTVRVLVRRDIPEPDEWVPAGDIPVVIDVPFVAELRDAEKLRIRLSPASETQWAGCTNMAVGVNYAATLTASVSATGEVPGTWAVDFGPGLASLDLDPGLNVETVCAYGNSVDMSPYAPGEYHVATVTLYSVPTGSGWEPVSIGTIPVRLDTTGLAPAITDQPDTQVVPLGEPATFSVVATGEGTLSYQWKKDGDEIPGAESPTYAIPSVAQADVGGYSCAVSNNWGTVESNSAALVLATEPVYFTDPALKTAVENALGTPDPTVGDMLGLTQFTANSLSIQDLTGLEYATNLQRLHLQENQITDLSPLSGLTVLDELSLRHNPISDIAPLAGLTSLTFLDLASCEMIVDISAVSGMVNLDRLNLYNNDVADITPLAPLTNLTILDLGGANNVSNIDVLSGLVNLTWLGLAGNPIDDFAPLSVLTNLESLNLYGTGVTDISSVASFTTLTWMDLRANSLNTEAYQIYIPQIEANNPGIELYYDPAVWRALTVSSTTGGSVIDPGEGAYQYANADVIVIQAAADVDYAFVGWSGTAVDAGKVGDPAEPTTTVIVDADYTLIATFASTQPINIPDPNLKAAIEAALDVSDPTGVDMLSLTELTASDSGIADLTGIEYAVNLGSLNLHRNNIGDIAPLSGLTNLTVLWLSTNQISDISPLAGLTNLTSLQFGFNQISDISPLAGLTNLTWLEFGANQTSDISALAGLTDLAHLVLWSNPISDISALSGLTNLTQLHFGNNQISDISPLSGLTNLTVLYLEKNQISDISALSGLTNLTWLHLWENQISDISALSGLKSLTHLYLYSNQISDISALTGLTSLTQLELSNNQIADIGPLVGLVNFSKLGLSNNPLNTQAYTTDIPQIEADNPGIELYYDAAVWQTLTVSSSTGGFVANPGEGGYQYVNGDIIPIEATADLNYAFVGWSGTAVDAGKVDDPMLATTTVTVDADYTLAAEFVTTQPVYIPDPNLKARVEEQLGIVDPTPLDMLQLTHLNAAGRGIADLTGLEYAANLIDLNLHQNPVNDISILAALPHLIAVKLSYSQLGDISPLAGLTQLQSIELTNTQVSDISVLAPLEELRVLVLNDNQISDISVLSGLPYLQRLELWGNQVTDISAISGLSDLMLLWLHRNQITDVSALSGLTNLERLDLSDNLITDISGLALLIHLNELWLDRNQITDISAVSGLTNLTGLMCNSNQVADINSVADLTGLTRLGLHDNQIGDISALASLTELTDLWLGYNQISDISTLANLTGLQALELDVNPISDISSLSALTSLTDLSVRHAQVSDLSALSGLADLQDLYLQDNQISDISPLVGLMSLLLLDLQDNPLNAQAHTTHIPQLMADNPGIEILYGVPTWRTLTVSSTAGGSVVDPGEGDLQYVNGEIVTIQAQAEFSYAFVGWSGTAVEAGKVDDPAQATTTVMVDADYTLVATFASTQAINIPDLNLKAAIEAQLGVVDPTALDMLTLTLLPAGGRAIELLTGLEYATNLTTLDLQDNQIGDISALGGLTNLTHLRLYDNQISDISALAGLTELEFLYLAENQISDISPLSGLTNLDRLWLNTNQISDISPLSGLANLRQLWLYENQISDISPLAGLTGLELLDLDKNQISDISALAGLVNLSSLELGGSQISDISPLAGLTNLGFLELYGNQISDISALSNLTDLWWLHLYGNQISDISALGGLTNLQELRLENNQVADIGPLVGLMNFYKLDLTNNPLNTRAHTTDIPQIVADNPGIEILYDAPVWRTLSVSSTTGGSAVDPGEGGFPYVNGEVVGVQAEAAVGYAFVGWAGTAVDAGKVDEPGQASTTVTVDADYTLTAKFVTTQPVVFVDPALKAAVEAALEIVDPDAVDMLGLVQLDIASLGVTSLAGLEYATNLESLWAWDNQISDLSPLAGLTKLGYLYLDNNHYISDLTPLAGLTQLIRLSLPGNQISQIDALAGLTNVDELRLEENQITDIGALAGLTHLVKLWLNNNQISDLGPLSGLTNLTTLWLNDNQISDVSALSGLTNLTTLLLGNNQIGDIWALSGLTNLTKLWASNNQISDVWALADLTNLTELKLDNNQISDISALSALTNLTILRLGDNQIVDVSALSAMTPLKTLLLHDNQVADITALSGLTNLEGLWCENNQISDISALAGLTNLTTLQLNDNQISDVSALAGLTNIMILHLHNNQISDITALAGLTSLTHLWLSGNQINDISSLAELTQLEKLLLQSNQISDVLPLSELTNLQELWLENNQISDISALSGLTNLVNLWLDDNQISDVSPLSGLTNLTHLWLYSNQISDVSPLSGLTNLTQLQMHSNQITDISALSGLTNLVNLWLDDNQISDISALSGLTNLTHLWLYSNQISDVSPLSGLTNLTRLWLEGNQISDISALAGLTNLTGLGLSRNLINDLSPLSGMANLADLRLESNPISDIWTLSGLANLQELYLRDCQISDISGLVGLTNLAILDLRGDPLNQAAHTTHIPQLIVDNPGVVIYYDGSIWYALTIDSTAGGSVTSPGEGVFPYIGGDVVVVEAEAEVDYAFVGWSGTAVDAGNVEDANSASTSVLVDADYTLQAHFEALAPVQYDLGVTSTAGGSVTQPGEGSFQYPDQTVLALAATADPGYAFSHWTGTAVDAGKVEEENSASTSVLIDADYTLQAHFEALPPVQYDLSTTSTAGGSVTQPGEGNFQYPDQTVLALIATADPGYAFSHWSGTAVDAGRVEQENAASTSVLIDADYTLQAHFEAVGPVMYTLYTLSTVGGSVTTPGEGGFPYPAGTTATVVATAEPGYVFSRWTGSAVDSGKVASPMSASTSVLVDHTYTVQAEFQQVDVEPQAPLTAYDPSPADAAQDVVQAVLRWKAGRSATYHEVYLGSTAELGPSTFLGRQSSAECAIPYALVPGITYYWRVDEVEADGVTVYPGEIWSFTAGTIATEDLVASTPDPCDGASNAVSRILHWAVGQTAVFHDIYFGASADLGPGELIGRRSEAECLIPSTLVPGTTYYWRVDEVEADGVTIHAGEVWSFTAGEPVMQILTVSSDGNGSVLTPGEGQFEVPQDTILTIEAAPANSDIEFRTWTGTAVEQNKVQDADRATTMALVDGDYTLEAVFAERAEGPTLGFTLGALSGDSLQVFNYRVATNNTPERTFVELVTGIAPDPKGMVRMQVVAEEPARAKTRFGKYEGQRVMVRFSYLFENAASDLELVAYLSDVPELIAHGDPLRAIHYAEVGRVAVPPAGRPGSVGSGRFGVFQAWVLASGLDLSNGTWIELELVQSGQPVSAASVSRGGIRIAASGDSWGSVLVDDCEVEVHCDGYCMDLNGSFSVDEEDFLIVMAYCGAPAGLLEGGLGSLYCLDGVFSSDGYIDPLDLGSWDWTLSDLDRTNLCFDPVPLVAGGATGLSALWADSVSAERSVSAAATGSLSDLLILGKGQLSTVLTDSLYTFGSDVVYRGNYMPAGLSSHCNLRLVRSPSGDIYAVNSERGVVRLTGSAGTAIPPGQASQANDPRYHHLATVFLGLQGGALAPSGRPILDVAFDAAGYAYVAPVVVQPIGGEAYVAAAKLALQEGANPPYQVVQLYDDPPMANDNQDPNRLREIEVDAAGNVYVVNAYRLNESDVLWKYGSDGTLLGRVALTEPNAPVQVADPLALHVSANGQTLYLASGQYHSADADSVAIYAFSTADLQYQDAITIQGMHRVTGITEDAGTGTLWVTGVAMGEIPVYPNPYVSPFYQPCLALVPPGTDRVEAVPLSNPILHDLALPTSVVWTGVN